VLRKLREAGFVAYWAGGCVRDLLLGRTPKDYDVATEAQPDLIRDLVGRRRPLAVGAAFGVITVVGPHGAGHVEVTTFRRDAAYSDGRHPDAVTFSSAQEDASRRDFTINGLFYDPIAEEVLDFVGGRADLAAGVIRAIGEPAARFSEDKLRMLRAVRFAATFGFVLDAGTAEAIRRMADQITVVSPERVAMEMRRMLVEPARVAAVRLLLETGLAQPVLPEIVPADEAGRTALAQGLSVLERLVRPEFPLALASLLGGLTTAGAAVAVCARWRLSNLETDRVEWLVANRESLRGAAAQRPAVIFRLLVHPGMGDLLAWHEAAAATGQTDPADAAWARAMLAGPRGRIEPPPLLDGDDLLARQIPPGPIYRVILDRVRDAQLDGRLRTKDEALALADRLAAEGQGG